MAQHIKKNVVCLLVFIFFKSSFSSVLYIINNFLILLQFRFCETCFVQQCILPFKDILHLSSILSFNRAEGIIFHSLLALQT